MTYLFYRYGTTIKVGQRLWHIQM